MRTKLFGTLAAVAFTPSQAWACEIDPFIFQLPGETVAVAQERSERAIADNATVTLYDRELAGFETATTIYLARVVAKTRGNYTPGHVTDPSATVRPIVALKGSSFSGGDRKLTGEGAGGLCTDRGDGLGVFAEIGELIVVYEGVPKTADRPRGIDSFRASAIRTGPLLDELRKHGKDLEN